MQVLSMVAGKVRKHERRTMSCNNFNLLKFSAIYGANASGKSNLIKALSVMQNIIAKGMNGQSTSLFYQLNEESKLKNSYFEVELLIDNKYYAYGFEVSFLNNVIKEEWLIELNENKEKIIFARNLKDATIKIKKDFSKDIKTKLKVYSEDAKKEPSMLFLSFLNSNKNSLYGTNEAIIFKKVYDWFNENLDIITPNYVPNKFQLYKDNIYELVNLLNFFGMEIVKVEYEKVNFTEKVFTKTQLQDIHFMLFQLGRENGRPELERLFLRQANKFWSFTIDSNNELEINRAIFYHKGKNDNSYPIDLESDGTTRIIDLAEILLTKDSNKLYVIDELDRCLHPLLTTKFIELFLEKASSLRNNNQLIVTTHETKLLDLDILRRDEIWLIEKSNGESVLIPFDNYNERFDKKIESAYLNGRYGGTPKFDDEFSLLTKK
jgi:AAA15 family ATPase/GTPase